jgi:hypothetical protein
VRKAKLGHSEELAALRRLDVQARMLEEHASGASWEQLVSVQREQSHLYGGRTVMGSAAREKDGARQT